MQVPIKPFCFSIAAVQLAFAELTSLLLKECYLLEARVIVHTYNHHVRLLSPEPLVVDNQSLLESKEPTSLGHHMGNTSSSQWGGNDALEGVFGCGRKNAVCGSPAGRRANVRTLQKVWDFPQDWSVGFGAGFVVDVLPHDVPALLSAVSWPILKTCARSSV